MILLEIGAGIQLVSIFPYLPIALLEVETAKFEDTNDRLRIMSANVLQANTNAGRLLTLVDQTNPDVLALVEVNDRWIDDLAELEAKFSHHLLRPLRNNFGIALYSKHELKTSEVRCMVSEEIPSIDATIALPSRNEVRLFVNHSNPA